MTFSDSALADQHHIQTTSSAGGSLKGILWRFLVNKHVYSQCFPSKRIVCIFEELRICKAKYFKSPTVYIHVHRLAVFFFTFVRALLHLSVQTTVSANRTDPLVKTLLHSTTSGQKLHGVPLIAIRQEIHDTPIKVFIHNFLVEFNAAYSD